MDSGATGEDKPRLRLADAVGGEGDGLEAGGAVAVDGHGMEESRLVDRRGKPLARATFIPCSCFGSMAQPRMTSSISRA